MRRIARDVFRRNSGGKVGTSSILLMARSSVAKEPRRITRVRLSGLLDRLEQAMEKQGRWGG
jgi:hypothetical protein